MSNHDHGQPVADATGDAEGRASGLALPQEGVSCRLLTRTPSARFRTVEERVERSGRWANAELLSRSTMVSVTLTENGDVALVIARDGREAIALTVTGEVNKASDGGPYIRASVTQTARVYRRDF